MAKMKPVSAYLDVADDETRVRTQNGAAMHAIQMLTLARIELGAFTGLAPLAEWARSNANSVGLWRQGWMERYGLRIGRSLASVDGQSAGSILVIEDWGQLNRARVLADVRSGVIWRYARRGNFREYVQFDPTEYTFCVPGDKVHYVPLGRDDMIRARAKKARLLAEGWHTEAHAVQFRYVDPVEVQREIDRDLYERRMAAILIDKVDDTVFDADGNDITDYSGVPI